jgi:acetone carboxylase gamma subunit
LIQSASGAGGLGDPIERSPELVLADFRDGRVTLNTCEKVYCVSLNPSNLKIDYVKTEELRRGKRKERLERGVPGGEFLKSLVERREKREFPKPVLDFFDELVSFSSEFRQQLETEKKFEFRKLKPLVKVEVNKEIMDLTPYVKIVEDSGGRKITVCSKCGFAYSEAKNDFKLFSLIYERDPADVYPTHLATDKNWVVYREFYCPGCATQVEVEQCPECMTIIQEAKLKEID